MSVAVGFRHPRESGDLPGLQEIPAFAGMTCGLQGIMAGLKEVPAFAGMTRARFRGARA